MYEYKNKMFTSIFYALGTQCHRQIGSYDGTLRYSSNNFYGSAGGLQGAYIDAIDNGSILRGGWCADPSKPEVAYLQVRQHCGHWAFSADNTS